MTDERSQIERLMEQIEKEWQVALSADQADIKRARALQEQILADQIASGLVDPEALSNYVGIQKERAEKAGDLQIPAQTDAQRKDAAEAFEGNLLQYHLNAPMMEISGGWGCYFQKPLSSWGQSYTTQKSNAQSDALVTGSHADLLASAKGDTTYTYDKKKKLNVVDKVEVNSAVATAIFYYQIPASCLPTYGGRIKLYPIWHLLGEYSFVGNAWTLYPDYMAQLKLGLTTAAYDSSLNHTVGSKQVLLEMDSKVAGTPTIEWAKSFKKVGHQGPSIEVDVTGGKLWYAIARLDLFCKAGGDLGAIWGNSAKLDFATGSYRAQIEELRVQTVSANPPPQTIKWAGYDDDRRRLEWMGTQTVDPSLIKPK